VSALLAQAIGQLNLQPGQTYRTTCNGHEVEVRVLEKTSPAETPEEPSQFADQVMLNWWLEIPPSPNAIRVAVRPGKPMLPPPLELDESDLAPG